MDLSPANILKASLSLLLALMTGLSPAVTAQGGAGSEAADEPAAPDSRGVETAAVTPLPPPYKSREDRQMRLLAKALADKTVDPDTVMWMTAASEEFLALYERDYTGAPQGAVLLLHAEGQHPGWPTTLNAIRTYLPNHGWSTLALTLPSPDSLPLPPRDEPQGSESAQVSSAERESPAADQDPAPAQQPPPVAAVEKEMTQAATNATAEGAIEPAEARAMERIAEAMRFLHRQNLFNIAIIGDGVGAARATAFLHSLADMKAPAEASSPENSGGMAMKPIRAMIIVNARNHIPASVINLPLALMDPEVATLDVYFGVDRRDQLEAQRRRLTAQRQKFQVYQQLKLPEMASLEHNENRLSRRIRGFLAQHARGIRVENATVK